MTRTTTIISPPPPSNIVKKTIGLTNSTRTVAKTHKPAVRFSTVVAEVMVPPLFHRPAPLRRTNPESSSCPP